MEDKKELLTTAEWNVMECLWEHPTKPLTGGEVAKKLAETVGWSRTTALTMLRRMEKKGLVASDDEGKKITYRPLIKRWNAVERENEAFLTRIYKGSVAEMLSAFTEQEMLSESDLDELYAILDKAKEWYQ